MTAAPAYDAQRNGELCYADARMAQRWELLRRRVADAAEAEDAAWKKLRAAWSSHRPRYRELYDAAVTALLRAEVELYEHKQTMPEELRRAMAGLPCEAPSAKEGRG